MTFFLSSLLVGHSPCQGPEWKWRDPKLSNFQLSMNFTEPFRHAEGSELICKGVKDSKREEKEKEKPVTICSDLGTDFNQFVQAPFISFCQYTEKAALAFHDQKINWLKLDLSTRMKPEIELPRTDTVMLVLFTEYTDYFFHNRVPGACVFIYLKAFYPTFCSSKEDSRRLTIIK